MVFHRSRTLFASYTNGSQRHTHHATVTSVITPPHTHTHTHTHTHSQATPLDLSQVVVNIEGACEDESSTDPRLDKTDGITGAFSTGDISRPLSIFSTGEFS